MNEHKIFLFAPADDWSAAFPVGNGSMGAMLFGDSFKEKIYLSEESIWNGDKIQTDGADFKEKTHKLREMYLQGETVFDDWAKENITKGIYRIKSNEYAGVLTLTFADQTPVENYRREIDLNNGVFSASYQKGGCSVLEEAFCSFAAKAICIRVSSTDRIDFQMEYNRENIRSVTHDDGVLTAKCNTQDGGHSFAVGIKTAGDCKTAYQNGKIHVSDSTSAIIFVSIATEFKFADSYETVCRDILKNCRSWDEMLAQHKADFSSLSGASDISFVCPKEVQRLPVDQRLKRLINDENARDDGLAALYFAYGKYLLISSSRKGTLPANLQGVWVEKLENPWNADYHTNINLQMNYWLPEIANISSCHLPLFDYMNEYLLPSGQKTAEEYYGCRGTMLHHLSDIYGYTAPADGLWGVWPLSGQCDQ